MNYPPIDKESARELLILSGRWVWRRTAREVAVELKAQGFSNVDEFVKTCDEDEIYLFQRSQIDPLVRKFGLAMLPERDDAVASLENARAGNRSHTAEIDRLIKERDRYQNAEMRLNNEREGGGTPS